MAIKKYNCCVLVALQHGTLFWGLFEDYPHKRKQLRVMLQDVERSISEDCFVRELYGWKISGK
jgi:hypothetical protein